MVKNLHWTVAVAVRVQNPITGMVVLGSTHVIQQAQLAQIEISRPRRYPTGLLLYPVERSWICHLVACASAAAVAAAAAAAVGHPVGGTFELDPAVPRPHG